MVYRCTIRAASCNAHHRTWRQPAGGGSPWPSPPSRDPSLPSGRAPTARCPSYNSALANRAAYCARALRGSGSGEHYWVSFRKRRGAEGQQSRGRHTGSRNVRHSARGAFPNVDPVWVASHSQHAAPGQACTRFRSACCRSVVKFYGGGEQTRRCSPSKRLAIRIWSRIAAS